MDWTGHVSVVTNAGTGIGLGIAEAFAEAGCRVVIGEVNKEAVVQHWMDNIPLERVEMPREMTLVARFLHSDDVSWVTGANLIADGGMTSLLINRERYTSQMLEGQYKS